MKSNAFWEDFSDALASVKDSFISFMPTEASTAIVHLLVMPELANEDDLIDY